MEFEFANQDKYEHVTLSSAQWTELISKARAAGASKQHMFILYCWANEQKVSNAAICAFRGKLIEDATSRSVGALAVDNINEWAKKITDNEKASILEWHPISGEWSISSYQLQSLRKALGCDNFIPKGSGVTG